MIKSGMRLWGKLPLAGFEIEVYLAPDISLDSNYGQYKHNRIIINETCQGTLFWSVLFHECCHAIFEHYDLKDFLEDSEDEEKVTAIVGTALHQMVAGFLKNSTEE